MIGNIRNRRVDFTGCRYVPSEYFESLKSVRRPNKGDVLYSLVGSYGIPALVTEDSPFCVQRHIGILRPSPRVTPKFLEMALNTHEVYRQATRCATGTAQLTVPLTGLRRIRIPVPPRPEQERVVEAIEEQFSRIDAGIDALQRAQRNAARLTKSIILSAVPDEYPEHWQRVTVADVGEVNLGRQRSPKYHNGPNMHPYLRVANVFEDRIDTSDVMSMHFDDDEFARYLVRPGDILLNEGQSPHLLGRPAMYRGDPPNVAFTNSLLRFRAGPLVLPAWALLVFRRHMHAKRFMRESRITTNIAHLSATRFKSVEFPVPPHKEQEEIVTATEEKLAEAARIAKSAEIQLTRAARIRTAILTSAFTGRLLSQEN